MNRKNLRRNRADKRRAAVLKGDGANTRALPLTATKEQLAEARYKDWLAERDAEKDGYGVDC